MPSRTKSQIHSPHNSLAGHVQHQFLTLCLCAGKCGMGAGQAVALSQGPAQRHGRAGGQHGQGRSLAPHLIAAMMLFLSVLGTVQLNMAKVSHKQ